MPDHPPGTVWAGYGSPSGLTSGPATLATRSGHADDHPVPERIPGQSRKLDAVAVLTGPLLPAPPLCPEFRRTQGSMTESCGVFIQYGRIRAPGFVRAGAAVLPPGPGPAGVLAAPAANRRGCAAVRQRTENRQGPDGPHRPARVLRLRGHGHRPGQAAAATVTTRTGRRSRSPGP